MTQQAFPHTDEGFTRLVIETMIDGIAVCHETAEPPFVHFTIWNPAMQELTGFTIDEINRLGWYQTVYVDPAVQSRARARTAFHTSHITHTYHTHTRARA